MKKYRFVFLLVLMIGSFAAGSWYSKKEIATEDVPPAKALSVQDAGEAETGSPPPGTVEITPERQQVIGVKVESVEKKPVSHTLRVLGRVAADETKIYRINAFVDGWIQEARPNTVGSLVKKNEILASFYSPEFLNAEQSYIYALGTIDRSQIGKRLELGKKELATPQLSSNLLNLHRWIDTLRGLGMGDRQIEEIGRTGQVVQDVHIISPANGFITARNVSPGQRFLKGDSLFQIVDLSRVWILADVYEHEAQYFQAGARVGVAVPYHKKTYSATVSKVLPVFDASTRTLKVRLEMENPGFELRPDMFADIELSVSLPPAIAVPVDAVLHSGLRKTVFVDRSNGFFERRQVETGWRMGEHVERIVISGTFFVDSESRLQLAGQGIFGMMSVDPVCGMEVDEAKASATGRMSVFQGKTYYFCAEDCKEQFDKEPQRFVKTPAEKHEKSMSPKHSGPGHD
ncbi:MAG: efflux RND transporter periplasmic adaptor subunit [Desulfobacterota bacterium]|nr:efflux RND transporter periplasmic adaptor subunit [Thermodesulfobacteriota bacterium]